MEGRAALNIPSGQTWRVFNHRLMQWKWNAWLQTPTNSKSNVLKLLQVQLPKTVQCSALTVTSRIAHTVWNYSQGVQISFITFYFNPFPRNSSTNKYKIDSEIKFMCSLPSKLESKGNNNNRPNEFDETRTIHEAFYSLKSIY